MTSVLDQMTAGIMQTKATKASKLTPVAGETGTTVAAEAAKLVLPSDVPGVLLAREALADIATDLRRQADIMSSIATGIDVMLGEPEAVATNDLRAKLNEVKLAEKEADRKAADRAAAEAGDPRATKRVEEGEQFEARLAKQAAAAQAATFAAADDGAEDDSEPSGQWECPTHGAANIKELQSRQGRKYRACNLCTAFEPKK